MDQVQSRAAVQKAEDLHRLADQGERRGIKILLTADGEHFATSTSSPSTLHRVSERGCDCAGFRYWQRCTHYALFLAQLGRLPDLEDVVLEEHHSERCRTCRGEGYVRAYIGGGLNDWTAVPCACTRRAA